MVATSIHLTSALAQHIAAQPLCDTHEHLRTEAVYLADPPDILQMLFQNYVEADLVVAGASAEAMAALYDKSNPDLRGRFAAVQSAWEAVQHTGYGEAVRLMARLVYGIEELTPAAIEATQPRHAELVAPGQRLHLLRTVANLDHVQVDDFVHPCRPDPSGPGFFFYDISWADFAGGNPNLDAVAQETGITVVDLATLDAAMTQLFDQNAGVAIAVKAQHAYNRTLRWQPRSDAEAAQALDRYLRTADSCSEAERLCLGDWCWARGVELAIEHDLPFKLHTGYYAGHSRMPVDRIRAGNLCPLLAAYPQARFVLMHIAYPYNDELVALAKHYANVYADLCWAWSIDPFSALDFVRRFIHAAPANKLFAFGGDTGWPVASVAYAHQARIWLARALQAEVDAGYLTEPEAIRLATRVMYDNQAACFRLEAKRAAVQEMARHVAQ
jgi:predicted TIM-barrel fold metal-dependent hydrolase